MNRDYIEFKDRSVPLAYLITFRCYGTWLHGDRRGSVNRLDRNIYETPRIPPNIELENLDRTFLKHKPIKLNAAMRKIVEKSVRNVCLHRDYKLLAIQVRTNHVHVVVSAGSKPEKIMTSMKAYATRALRNGQLVDSNHRIWSRHGSTRYLWTEKHIELAVDYVLHQQGAELPEFDR